MARRPVAVIAAVVLILESVGIVLLNWFLGLAVDRQRMSLDGLDPDAMSAGTWVMGAVFGLFLLCCGFLLLRSGIRDRAPGRIARIALISCAVIHAVLGALTVGLVGWAAFAFMMVVFGLVVLSLIAFDSASGGGAAADARTGGGGTGGADGGRPVTDTPPPSASPGPNPA